MELFQLSICLTLFAPVWVLPRPWHFGTGLRALAISRAIICSNNRIRILYMCKLRNWSCPVSNLDFRNIQYNEYTYTTSTWIEGRRGCWMWSRSRTPLIQSRTPPSKHRSSQAADSKRATLIRQALWDGFIFKRKDVPKILKWIRGNNEGEIYTSEQQWLALHKVCRRIADWTMTDGCRPHRTWWTPVWSCLFLLLRRSWFSCSSLFLRPSLSPQFCNLNGLFPIVLILVEDGQAKWTVGILQVTEWNSLSGIPCR